MLSGVGVQIPPTAPFFLQNPQNSRKISKSKDTNSTMIGFKRKYFSLRAIQASTTSVTLHAKNTHIAHYNFYHFQGDEPCDSSAPPDELLEASSTLTKEPDQSRPCHCHALLVRRTRTLFHALIPYFLRLIEHAHVASGIAPPFPLFFHPNYQTIKEKR